MIFLTIPIYFIVMRKEKTLSIVSSSNNRFPTWFLCVFPLLEHLSSLIEIFLLIYSIPLIIVIQNTEKINHFRLFFLLIKFTNIFPKNSRIDFLLAILRRQKTLPRKREKTNKIIIETILWVYITIFVQIQKKCWNFYCNLIPDTYTQQKHHRPVTK